jgi:hypothetical protein
MRVFARLGGARLPVHTVGELMSRPFCMAQWVATGYAIGMVFAPGATRLAGVTMTAAGAGSESNAGGRPPAEPRLRRLAF